MFKETSLVEALQAETGSQEPRHVVSGVMTGPTHCHQKEWRVGRTNKCAGHRAAKRM